MTNVIVTLWIINLVLSLICTVFFLPKGQKVWLTLYFILLPVLGMLLYFIPVLLLYISDKHTYDRESLVGRLDIEEVQAVPQVQKALNVVPVEDAMAVSSNQEKRFLLLDQLKQDMHSNYKYILAASGDADSESAHYVATGKTEVYRKKQESLTVLRNAVANDPEDLQLLEEYVVELISYIDSGLLASRESLVYKVEYCRCFETLHQTEPERITASINAAYITYLLDLEKQEVARQHWDTCRSEWKDEAGYRKMLEMYYNAGDKEGFYTCFDMLEQSDIVLSPDGLTMLRFWKQRRNSLS